MVASLMIMDIQKNRQQLYKKIEINRVFTYQEKWKCFKFIIELFDI